MNKIIIIFCLCTCMLGNVFAQAMLGEREVIVIEEDHTDLGYLYLKHCRYDSIEGQVLLNTCQQIGTKEKYHTDELKKISRYEKLEAVGKIVGDIVIVVGLVAAGAEIGVGAIAISSSPQISKFISVLAGGVTGLVTSTTLISLIDKLNPITQVRQARVINKKLVNGEIKTSDKKVLRTVRLLNQILN